MHLMNSGPTKCTPRLLWIQQTSLHSFKFSQDFSLNVSGTQSMFAWSSYSSKQTAVRQQLQSASWSQQGSSRWFLFVRTSSYCSLDRRPSVTLLLSSNLGNITAMYPSVEGCAKKEHNSHTVVSNVEKGSTKIFHLFILSSTRNLFQ